MPPSLFDPFDYAALGHLHGPQSAGAPFVRYCGSPLKYSLSEAGQQKSATLVELRQKGEAEVRVLPCGGLCSYYAEREGLIIGFGW